LLDFKCSLYCYAEVVSSIKVECEDVAAEEWETTVGPYA
jgi:hypothetical protein